MLNIRKVSTILCLLYLCGGIQNTILCWLSKQISKIFFQMSARVYFVHDDNDDSDDDDDDDEDELFSWYG